MRLTLKWWGTAAEFGFGEAVHKLMGCTHARRLIECLSEISWGYYQSISFPASVKEVVTGKAFIRFDNEEVHSPLELIETRGKSPVSSEALASSRLP